ncbi:CLUMA_CG016708, isoform A [Clunio marinus]|uniref:CLUMA_CG016708, isoform A n=1 Tax=Clunio marinus TaxID=568069 RepID=A0A1J1ITI5_9DIPT|nr:CLUMA_CG016708, isoform A [Clunio marinus]
MNKSQREEEVITPSSNFLPTSKQDGLEIIELVSEEKILFQFSPNDPQKPDAQIFPLTTFFIFLLHSFLVSSISKQ